MLLLLKTKNAFSLTAFHYLVHRLYDENAVSLDPMFLYKRKRRLILIKRCPPLTLPHQTLPQRGDIFGVSGRDLTGLGCDISV